MVGHYETNKILLKFVIRYIIIYRIVLVLFAQQAFESVEKGFLESIGGALANVLQQRPEVRTHKKQSFNGSCWRELVILLCGLYGMNLSCTCIINLHNGCKLYMQHASQR